MAEPKLYKFAISDHMECVACRRLGALVQIGEAREYDGSLLLFCKECLQKAMECFPHETLETNVPNETQELYENIVRSYGRETAPSPSRGGYRVFYCDPGKLHPWACRAFRCIVKGYAWKRIGGDEILSKSCRPDPGIAWDEDDTASAAPKRDELEAHLL